MTLRSPTERDDTRRALPRTPPAAERTLDSRELLDGCREVFIRHGEDVYRLRLTRNGKLILHK